jgi:hypothetical protein
MSFSVTDKLRYIDNSIPVMIRLDIDFFIISTNFTPHIGAIVNFFVLKQVLLLIVVLNEYRTGCLV